MYKQTIFEITPSISLIKTKLSEIMLKIIVLTQETINLRLKKLNLLLMRRNLGLGWKQHITNGAYLDLSD
jgi:hypothetical protein